MLTGRDGQSPAFRALSLIKGEAHGSAILVVGAGELPWPIFVGKQCYMLNSVQTGHCRSQVARLSIRDLLHPSGRDAEDSMMQAQTRKTLRGALAGFILLLQLLIGPLHLLEVDHSDSGHWDHNVQSPSVHSSGEHSTCSDSKEKREPHPAADHLDQLALPSHLETSFNALVAPISTGEVIPKLVVELIGRIFDRDVSPRAPPLRRTAPPRAPPIAT